MQQTYDVAACFGFQVSKDGQQSLVEHLDVFNGREFVEAVDQRNEHVYVFFVGRVSDGLVSHCLGHKENLKVCGVNWERGE